MRTKMGKRGAAVVVAMVASLGPLGMAPAAVAEELSCAAEFSTLTIQTEAASYEGRNAEMDEAGLLGKIAEAQDKFSLGKAVDSDGKLANYQDKVQRLRTAGKIVEPEGVDLVLLAQAARDCVLPPA